MDYDELVQRLRVWSLDERRGDGMLLVRTADAITKLRAERDALRAIIKRASSALHGGEGVADQWQAYDLAIRVLDAALAGKDAT